ncbi:hypothetical protein [Bacteroides heparinolyticus]|uniref:hypothetical protein n=1 Tax=Prevotella heparinolytica TaxID=28113 RepID=UPI0035A0DB4F
MMKMKLFFATLLAVLTLSSQSYGQTFNKKDKFDLSASLYHRMNGEPSFTRLGSIAFAYKVSPTLGVGLDFTTNGSLLTKNRGLETYAFSLKVSHLGINEGRFRLVPSLGLGAVTGTILGLNYTHLFLDCSVEAQYFLTNNIYCGVQLRYLTERAEYAIAHNLLGIKFGSTF